jgi:thiamine biosynthesis lipoprotein
MSEKFKLTRRQFLQIIAIGGVAGLVLKEELDELAGLDIVSETRLLMGTVVNLTIITTSTRRGREAISACLDRMVGLEMMLSRFQSNSQLSRLNRDGKLSNASLALIELLNHARQVSELSDGAFDITIKPLVDMYWQAAEDEKGLPTPEVIAETLKLVDYRQVEVMQDQVQLGKPGMAITLDGIAKGYIVDEGVAVLHERGFSNVLVEAGGDLLALGERRSGDAWQIGIASPRDTQPELLARISVHNNAVATSGDYMQAFSPDFSLHHIIDPHTGYSSSWLASATVTSPTAVLADALATTLMVVGPESGLKLLERFPGCEAYLVTKDLEAISSSGFGA